MTQKHRSDDELDIELTDAPASGGAARAVHIACDGTVRRQIIDFAMTDTRRELGGVLLGVVSQDSEPTVQITAMIPAQHTDAGSASVTFTHETWQEMLAVKDRDFPDLKIVGWFHTHPGFGIFLSRFDLHIHENFFNLEWQVAYVVDPLAHTEGFFRWENGAVRKTPDFTVAGELPVAPVPAPVPVPAPTPGRRVFDWHYLAIAVLLGTVTYLQFFRPQVVVRSPAPVAVPLPIRPSGREDAAAPPPSPESAAANSAERWPIYIVQPNDSLWTISARCYGDGKLYRMIVIANHLSSEYIVPGMRLYVPGGTPPVGAVADEEALDGR